MLNNPVVLALAIAAVVLAYANYFQGPFYRRRQQRSQQWREQRPWGVFPAEALFSWFEGARFIGQVAGLLIGLVYSPALICYVVASVFLWSIHQMIFGLTPKHIAIPNYVPSIVGLSVAAYETYLLARIFVRWAA